MPSFRDAVANYNKTKGPEAAVPLNPPEAKTVLVQQTTPEVEAPKAPPAPTQVSPPSPDASASTPNVSAASEPTKRTRRTKAEMEDARAAESQGRTASSEAAPVASSGDGPTPTLLQRIVALQQDLPEGVTLTLTIIGRG
jgi:hypothetical protein